MVVAVVTETAARGSRPACLDVTDEATSSAIARALGEELRRTREARGWSRAQFVQRLPSRIGDRTLLAYEHGLRQLTVLRLLELSEGLGVSASVIVAQALQRARLCLDNLVLRVDLRELLRDTNNTYRPMFPWARNRLSSSTNGVIEVTPSGVRELTAVLGRTSQEISAYLARFTPESSIEEQKEPVST
jgi:transcriptional regulator with XRE-family HTH domain